MQEGGESSGYDIEPIQEEEASESPESPVEAAEETIPEEEDDETSLETASSTCVNVALKLTTDGYPQETRFQLVDLLSSTPFFYKRIWSERGFLANKEYQYSACVDPTGCYAFYISDLFGDGLCCR